MFIPILKSEFRNHFAWSLLNFHLTQTGQTAKVWQIGQSVLGGNLAKTMQNDFEIHFFR